MNNAQLCGPSHKYLLNMKNSLFLIALSGFLWSSCQNDGNTEAVQEIRGGGGPNSSLIRNPVSADLPLDTNQLARITYTEPEFDFGEAKEGEVVEHEFEFTNTGNIPLTILGARSSCGCTVPEWPRDPVQPGGKGVIKAKFNTEGKLREQKKTIYITANTYPNETRVMLKGTVHAR